MDQKIELTIDKQWWKRQTFEVENDFFSLVLVEQRDKHAHFDESLLCPQKIAECREL